MERLLMEKNKWLFLNLKMVKLLRLKNTGRQNYELYNIAFKWIDTSTRVLLQVD